MDKQVNEWAKSSNQDRCGLGVRFGPAPGHAGPGTASWRPGWVLLAVALAVGIGQAVPASPPDCEAEGAGRIAQPSRSGHRPDTLTNGSARIAQPSRSGHRPDTLTDPNAQPPRRPSGAAKLAVGPDQPGEQTEVPAAVAIEVEGSVEWAGPGVAVLAVEGWTPVKLNDRLEPGRQIRTGLRSHVNLRFGQATFVSVRSATYASIDQFYRSAKAESVRLDLAYGTIRGGSTEGEVRSDVTVESPVAALLKRGTEGWEMQVEPMTGRFRISLARHGLVEAIQKLRSGQRVSRGVRPGEYATERNIANMWIKQDIFDRNVKFYQAEALTLADAEFTAGNTRGYATLAPGGGSTLVDLSGRVNAASVLDQLSDGLPGSAVPPFTAVLTPLPISRPEGNFGTGGIFRVLLPRPQ